MTTDDEFKTQTIAELKAGDRRMDEMGNRLAALELACESMRTGLVDNSSAVKRVEDNTGEMLAIFQSWKGAMKALETIGKVARPISYIVGLGTAMVAAYAAIRTK